MLFDQVTLETKHLSGKHFKVLPLALGSTCVPCAAFLQQGLVLSVRLERRCPSEAVRWRGTKRGSPQVMAPEGGKQDVAHVTPVGNPTREWEKEDYWEGVSSWEGVS